MPFTPSHAVVALPFLRTPLVPAAIAVGAMTPDLPLFVRGLGLDRLGWSYERTHAFAWLPTTILLALVLLVVWRCVLRPAVRELAPRWLAARLPGEWDRGALPALRETLAVRRTSQGDPRRWTASWAGIALLLASLLIGILSHIVWDLFTHAGRWGTLAVPALAQQWGPLRGHTWVQHGSSAAGLVILAVWMSVWLARREPAASVPRVLPSWVRLVWWITLPVFLIVAWVWGLIAFGPLTTQFTPAHLAYRVLPPACAWWGALTLALAVLVQARRR